MFCDARFLFLPSSSSSSSLVLWQTYKPNRKIHLKNRLKIEKVRHRECRWTKPRKAASWGWKIGSSRKCRSPVTESAIDFDSSFYQQTSRKSGSSPFRNLISSHMRAVSSSFHNLHPPTRFSGSASTHTSNYRALIEPSCQEKHQSPRMNIKRLCTLTIPILHATALKSQSFVSWVYPELQSNSTFPRTFSWWHPLRTLPNVSCLLAVCSTARYKNQK